MNKSFFEKTILLNYILMGIFIAMLLFASIYYRNFNILGVIVIIVLATIIKLFRIRHNLRLFDERNETLYYKALSVGFYFLLITILFFYSMELAKNNGIISIRTTVELFSALIGYIGTMFYLKKKY